MAEVTITVQPSAEVEVDVDGVKGASCSDIVGSITKALGVKTANKKKPEYYQTGGTTQSTRA